MDNHNSQSSVASPSRQQEEEEINLLDLLLVLARNKKMIVGVTLFAALLAVGISLLMPNIYPGTTRILPPQQSQSSASALLSQLGGLAGMAEASNPNDMYVAMLKSRNITEKIARRFDLQNVYEQETMDETLKKFAEEVSVSAGADGIIVLEVDDEDPKRAADMANVLVVELDGLVKNFAITGATNQRVFFERQMKEAKDKLTDAELVLDSTPNTGLGYLDAVRNLKYREAVYEILSKQFEMAKLDEAKDYPLIQVLDKAVPPEKKSRPSRSLIVILAALIAMCGCIIWIFVREGLVRSSNEQRQQLHQALRWRN